MTAALDMAAPAHAADRAAERRAALARWGWGAAALVPLPGDASHRRYFRLADPSGRRALLMDVPLELEPIQPFLTLARHLGRLGLSAPQILAEDADLGLALIEDFGEATYTRLLDGGADPQPLYERAVDVLIALHADPHAAEVDAPPFDLAPLMVEVHLFVDWYLPVVLRRPLDAGVRRDLLALWVDLLSGTAERRDTLALADYHVDNLMVLDRPGVASVGLLDFQDGMIGSRAYDLMSLLEDARRDVPADHAHALRTRYHTSHPCDAAFEDDYARLAVQRHAKVAGIFTRLWLRDGKPAYLAHIPRVLRLLKAALALPPAAALAHCLASHCAGWDAPLPPAAEAGRWRGLTPAGTPPPRQEPPP
ncbi:MAG: phosphotransferase [Rhodospirillaceae bacterium]|nr:phosphotransferase [Rhodospirillaceae bacterium]